jgi:hypothetical protein
LAAGGFAELRKVAFDQKMKKIIYFLIFNFWFSSWALAAWWSSARSPATSRKKKYFILFYLFIYFPPLGLTPWTSAGLSHGSPPFEFEVAFCPPPTC